MRHNTAFTALALLPLLVACGGEGAPPKAPMSDGNAAISGGAHAALPVAAGNNAGEAALWAHLPKEAKNFGVVDFAGILASPLGQLAAVGGKYLDLKLDVSCKVSLLGSVRRMAITGNDDDVTGAVIETTIPVTDLIACLTAQGHKSTSTFEGLTSLDLNDKDVAVVVGTNLIVIAPKGQAHDRIEAHAGHANVLVDGRLSYGEFNTRVDPAIPMSQMSLALVSRPGLTEAVLHGSLTKATGSDQPDPADTVTTLFHMFTRELKLPQNVVNAFTLKTTSDDITLSFGAKGSDSEQRAFLTEVTKIAEDQFTQRANQDKRAEAHVNLNSIRSHAESWFERQDLDPKTKTLKIVRAAECPPSAPLTPAVVPKGHAVTAQASEWAAPGWKAIKFDLTESQNYSYGIDRSKDGKTCTFYAVGDINGDGKTSRFELQAQIVKNAKGVLTMQVAPSVQETNPEE